MQSKVQDAIVEFVPISEPRYQTNASSRISYTNDAGQKLFTMDPIVPGRRFSLDPNMGAFVQKESVAVLVTTGRRPMMSSLYFLQREEARQSIKKDSSVSRTVLSGTE